MNENPISFSICFENSINELSLRLDTTNTVSQFKLISNKIYLTRTINHPNMREMEAGETLWRTTSCNYFEIMRELQFILKCCLIYCAYFKSRVFNSLSEASSQLFFNYVACYHIRRGMSFHQLKNQFSKLKSFSCSASSQGLMSF